MIDLTKLVKEKGEDKPDSESGSSSRSDKGGSSRRRKHSTMGRVSCVMALAALVLSLIGVPAKQAVGSVSAAILVILLCCVAGLCVMGIIAAVMGLLSKRRSPLLAVAGLVVNPMIAIAFGIYLWWPMPQTLVTAAANNDVAQIQRAVEMGVDINATSWFTDHDDSRLTGTALVAAALNGQKAAVRSLLILKADTNGQDSKGRTALYHAASQGHVDLVLALLKGGADPNISPPPPLAPALYLASRQGNQQIVDALLKHKANVNVSGFPPLIPAAAAGHTKIVERLLDHGAQVNTADDDGTTALHAAAVKGYQYVVRLLLRSDADPALRNSFGETPLELALEGKHELVVADLLNVGSPIDIFAAIGLNDMEKTIAEIDRDAALLTATRRARTPLHVAAAHGRAEITRFLLERGAAINARTNVDGGATPLYLATAISHDEVVDILLEKDADPNLEVVTEDARGPALYFAVVNGDLPIVDKLILAGADVNVQCTTTGVDGPPLIYAVKHMHHKVAQRLLEAKADVNFRKNSNSPTPLFEAVRNADADMVALLIRGGANVNAKVGNRTAIDEVELIQRGHDKAEQFHLIHSILRTAGGLN
ncbi:MAG: ankyrin repeat domain-containing protein [Phycisphaeraceae bacterium]